jgi:hypothetical protein
MGRAGGHLLVAAAVWLIVEEFRLARVGLEDKAGSGMPILTCALGLYLAGFVAVTARASGISARVVTIAGVSGATGAAFFAVPVLLRPPIPPDNGWALLVLLVTGCAAAAVTAWRAGDRGVPSLVAGMAAAAVAALVVFVVAIGLMRLPSWVPDVGPANVPAADRLANSRAGAEDPYYGVLLLGALLSLAVTAVALAVRRAARTSGEPEPENR